MCRKYSVPQDTLYCRTEYYSDKNSEFGNDQKSLFKLTNSLLGNTNTVVLPSHQSETELANRFGSYFLGKIETIRINLSKANKDLGDVDTFIADTLCNICIRLDLQECKQKRDFYQFIVFKAFLASIVCFTLTNLILLNLIGRRASSRKKC